MATRGGYGLVPQSNFAGGLNLAERADLVEPAQAIDLRDVVFPENGGIKQRDAYRNLTASPLGDHIEVMAPHYEEIGGIRQLLVGNGDDIDVIRADGTLEASYTMPFRVRSFVRMGNAGGEYTYAATGASPPVAWNGTAFVVPVWPGPITPTGKFLAAQMPDNRMVSASEPGFTSRVRFSDAGAAQTFQTDSYVDLRPGSGEGITAIASWREYVIVFKESEFFVFYGNTINSLGNAEFNYRPISVRAGSLGAVAVAPEGVYFADRRGIWLTNGSEPKLISSTINGLFTGIVSPYYTGGVLNQFAVYRARLAYLDGKLYYAFNSANEGPGGTNDKLAVYNTKTGTWSIFSIPAVALTTFFSDQANDGTWYDYRRNKLVLGLPNHHVGVYWEGSEYTRDGALLSTGEGGYPLTSFWRQSWQDFGSSDQKWLRQTKLFGTGSVRAGIQTDYVLSTGTLDTATMSSAGDAIAKPWLLSQSRVGHLFSIYVASNGEPWSLNSIEHGFRLGRGPEILGKRT